MQRSPVLLAAAVVWCLAPAVSIRAAEGMLRLRGFVIAVESPSVLIIDDYRITEHRTYRVRLDSAPKDPVYVGTDVEMNGSLDPGTGEFTAVELSVKHHPFEPIRLTALVSQPWSDDVLNADGRRIRITSTTRISYSRWRDRAQSLSAVTPGTFVMYDASTRDADGAIVADRVEFSPNEQTGAERTFLKDQKIETKAPDFERHRPGGVRYHQTVYFQIIPDAGIQQYVGDLGSRLVPAYQRGLPDGDPAKISFAFYVVKNHDAGAQALPNGIVLITSHLFDILENEAQLAAVIGHEISHVTQEHAWILSKTVDRAFGNRYSRQFEDQADRLGLEAMTAAGYDPREAPAVLKVMSQKLGFVQSVGRDAAHNNHSVRREYLMTELEQTYRDLDYASMRIEADRFQRIARMVKGAVDPTWKAKHER